MRFSVALYLQVTPHRALPGVVLYGARTFLERGCRLAPTSHPRSPGRLGMLIIRGIALAFPENGKAVGTGKLSGPFSVRALCIDHCVHG